MLQLGPESCRRKMEGKGDPSDPSGGHSSAKGVAVGTQEQTRNIKFHLQPKVGSAKKGWMEGPASLWRV